jgi:ketosteroid isomerase-like protein
MDDTERLLIERACERLVQAYCHLTDHGRAAEVAELFTEDGVWVSAENTMSGRAGIQRGFLRRQENAARMSRHVCSNLLIEVMDSDTAKGVVYLTLYRHDGEPGRLLSPLEGPIMVGEYSDTFVRTADGWRFKRRDVTICFSREAVLVG